MEITNNVYQMSVIVHNDQSLPALPRCPDKHSWLEVFQVSKDNQVQGEIEILINPEDDEMTEEEWQEQCMNLQKWINEGMCDFCGIFWKKYGHADWCKKK